MPISKQQVDSLLKMLALTNDVEQDCDGCLKVMAEFAETSLAGKSIPGGLRSIEEHLKICGECREEFETLKVALSNQAFE
jgi:hypothetical protein